MEAVAAECRGDCVITSASEAAWAEDDLGKNSSFVEDARSSVVVGFGLVFEARLGDVADSTRPKPSQEWPPSKALKKKENVVSGESTTVWFVR